jgi:chromosome segregation ATPase
MDRLLRGEIPPDGNCDIKTLAREAGVSRTFCYDNPQARTAIAQAGADRAERRRKHLDDQDSAHEASWREQALNAEDAFKTATTEIHNQRTRIAQLLGQIRDLTDEWNTQDVQRVTSENATLKQHVRALSAENRTLQERLAAARSTLRFQDKRIAELEANIADPLAPTAQVILLAPAHGTH